MLRAADSWGKWASSRKAWTEAAEAYGHGMAAVRRLFQIQLGRRHKETSLYSARGLPSEAVYALAKDGQLEEAAVAAEQGRALLLSETLERDRAELKSLRAGHPDLVARYERISARLASYSGEEPPIGQDLPDPEVRANALRAAWAEWEAVVAEIRALPGHERFLQPPEFTDIVAAASQAPLVYLFTTQAGGLALVVRGDGSVRLHWLPEADQQTVNHIVSTHVTNLRPHLLAKVLGAVGEEAMVGLGKQLGEAQPHEQPIAVPMLNVPPHRLAEAFATGSKGAVASLEKQLREEQPKRQRVVVIAACEVLWGRVMEPVLQALRGETQAVLIPSGMLGLLPLHEARVEDPTAPTGYRYALDELLLTYAPNARALSLARRHATSVSPGRALVVEDPAPVSTTPLPSAGLEGEILQAAFPQVRRLPGEKATVEALRTEIGAYPVLHFACHGRADEAEPLDSGLLLAGDRVLRLRDLFNLRITARLAVLSACESAMSGDRLPDEVVGLPTGLLQAGAAGVVGTQCTVSDVGAMLVMLSFYDHWRRGGLEPAEALRCAQQWVRDTTNADKRELFSALLQTDCPWPSRAVVAAAYEAVVLQPPEERGFAEPVSWAAFLYTGC